MRLETKLLGTLALALVGIVAWAWARPQAVPAAAQAAIGNAAANPGDQARPPVLGHLKGRQHTITIHTAADGTRFTVATNQGEVLAEALSADEMRRQHPDLLEMYKSSFAGSGGYLDASVPPAVRGDAGRFGIMGASSISRE